MRNKITNIIIPLSKTTIFLHRILLIHQQCTNKIQNQGVFKLPITIIIRNNTIQIPWCHYHSNNSFITSNNNNSNSNTNKYNNNNTAWWIPSMGSRDLQVQIGKCEFQIDNNQKIIKIWGEPGLEPGTSRTRSGNHTSRPHSRTQRLWSFKIHLKII